MNNTDLLGEEGDFSLHTFLYIWIFKPCWMGYLLKMKQVMKRKNPTHIEKQQGIKIYRDMKTKPLYI